MKVIQTNEILSKLGVLSDDKSLQEYMRSMDLKIPENLKLKSSQYDVHIEFEDLDISMLFTDEAKFLGIENQAIGQGPLYFTGLFFYSDGEGNSNSDLPLNLSFEDKIEDVEDKLGEPSWSRDRKGQIISQRWDINECHDFTIHITYDLDTHYVSEVIAFLPKLSKS